MSPRPSTLPNLRAAEEALYQLSIKAGRLAAPLMRFLDETDQIFYDALEERDPQGRPRPTPRIERPVSLGVESLRS